jgi:hypothetical protein
MALFGFLGGLVAWVLGEIVFVAVHSNLEEFEHIIAEAIQIEERVAKGEMSLAAAAAAQERLGQDHRNNPIVGLLLDKDLSDQVKERLVKAQVEKENSKEFVRHLLWFSLLGIALALSLAVADPIVGRNWRGVVVNGSVGICLGLLGGLLVGFFINRLYQAMGGGQATTLAQQMFARTVGWGILGLFLAIAPGVVLRNFKRLAIGLAGGFLGGLLGGLLFDPVGMGTGNGVLSRAVALLAIGAIAGVGTGLIENVAKTGWLKVVAGLIAGKQFILYRNPTLIGSSPQCEIYLFKDTQIQPRHAAIHTVRGGFELEDLQSASGTYVNGQRVSRTRLKNGDQVQVGGTCLTFSERARSVQ